MTLFRRGELWANRAVPFVLMAFNGFGLHISAIVAVKTEATTLWAFSIVVIIAILVGYIVSSGTEKANNNGDVEFIHENRN